VLKCTDYKTGESSPARTLHLSSNPQLRKAHRINIGVYEELPAIYEALEWLEVYGGGRYFIKNIKSKKPKNRLPKKSI
jgi:hypothetical protein